MAHVCVWGGVYAQIFKCEVFLVARIPYLRGGNSDRVS